MAADVMGWLRRRKAVASAVAIAVLAGVPITVASMYKGFPVADLDLNALDVWVTAGDQLLGGRLNHQIDDLDAVVSGASSDLDVLQDSNDYFLADSSQGTVQRIDPAYVSLSDQITIPKDSWVGYGGDTMAILAPDGRLWTIGTADRLEFNAAKTTPSAKLGKGAVAVVAKTGEVFAVSPDRDELATVARPGKAAQITAFDVEDDAQLSAVGDTAVVLDKGGQRLRTPDRTLKAPSGGLKLQQPSAASDVVLVAGASDLYRVPLSGGAATAVPSGGTEPSSVTADQVPAPVQVDGCDYAAWSANTRYVYACTGSDPVAVQIPEQKTAAQLEFRVNHGVVALNDVRSGDAWVATKTLKLVNDWSTLTPDKKEQKKSDKGEVQPVKRSYQDMVAKRGTTNTRPDAQDDDFGVRQGRATLLPVLDNDQDEDGDVLTVADTDPSQLSASVGTLDLVDGGRALQYTPAPGFTGGFSFHYTVTDGRSGGEDTATVHVTIHASAVNAAPVQNRESQTDVEAGQTATYNVLQDWIDPDGDGIYLDSVTPSTSNDVSFTPDGEISFTAKSGELGSRTVDFVVSDGSKKAQGTLEVDVKAKGSLKPVAVPDFAEATLGRALTLDPLENDESPSGASLDLVSADPGDTPLEISVDEDAGTLRITGTQTGTYYFTYQLAAGSSDTVDGLVRVDVVEPEKTDAPPLAVNDVAYVHPAQTTEVAPLDNDVSPSGRVLAVRSVTGGDDATALNIQLLDNTVVRITSPGVLEKQVQLSYELSDGLKTVTGTITVVPVAPLVNYQPPVAVTDAVNVRAGDIATVDVLDNDYSPDDQPFSLQPTLVSTKRAGGSAFVSGDTVRYLAPEKAGTYEVTYRIEDEHDQTDTAEVIFQVLPDGSSDRAPEPQTLTARAFAGSAIPITVPLNGIDPDGDSVFFDGVTDEPELGRVTGTTATGFVYEAAASDAGTDEFHYQVEDTHGKTATGVIRIAVIPRPTSLQPPTAVNDTVEVKPGKTASVQVLANDSDPNGYALSLKSKLDQVDDGFRDLSVDGSSVLFTAPTEEGTYQFHYTVDNGHGGQAGAYVQVTVRSDAEPRYPTAIDHYVTAAQVNGRTSVSVDALDGAVNPSGPVDDLTVSLPSATAKVATVSGSTITVKPQKTRTVIAYQVTDPATKLTGKAFIIVPPANVKTTQPTSNAADQSTPKAEQAGQSSDKPASSEEKAQQKAEEKAKKGKGTQPPHLKVGTQVVPMNGQKTFAFSQILSVPSGRSAELSGTPTATHGTVKGSGASFTFTPAKDYRGPASVTFTVDDGREEGASRDRHTELTLQITVGSADQSDVPPTFTPPKVQIEPGEAAKSVDLRAASYHPNQKILNSLTYTDLKQSSINGITATLKGSTLKVSTPVTAKPGTTATFRFTVNSPTKHVAGSVKVTVTSSTRPLAQQKNAPQKISMKRGTSKTVSNAVGTAYWVNPFPDKALKIVSASVVSSPVGVSVSHTATSITVKATSGAAIGQANITYTVQDATGDTARRVIGRLQATIHDVPAQPQAPSNVSANDKHATFTIKAPANHGLKITGYNVLDNHGHSWHPTSATTMTVSGLTNGTSYRFRVQAVNADGPGPWSAPSAAVTPYGTPSVPTNLRATASDDYAKASFTFTWGAPQTSGGGTVRYQWTFNGNSGTTLATSHTTAKLAADTYKFKVRAVNVGSGKTSDWVTKTVTLSAPPKPAKKVTLSNGAPGPAGHYYQINVSGFSANTSYQVKFWCEGDPLVSHTSGKTYVETLRTGAAGNGSLNTHNTVNGEYCGYSNAWVTVGGKKSNTVDMR